MKIRKRYLMVTLWGALSAAFFLVGVANAGPVSPVGQSWDFTVSGAKLGSAYLTFSDDGAGTINSKTVTGYIIVIPATASRSSGINPHQTSFGYAQLQGLWQMDGNQVVGFLNNSPSDTVRLDITSFSGTPADNQGNLSFTIKGVTADGNLTLSGAPSDQYAYTPMPGTWTIEKYTQGQLTFNEIFTATSDPDHPDEANLYQLTGQGSDRCIFGHGVLSKGNNLNAGFAVAISEYEMPSNNDCTTVDQTQPPLYGSAGIGRIDFHIDADRTAGTGLKGYQQGAPSPWVKMPVICNNP